MFNPFCTANVWYVPSAIISLNHKDILKITDINDSINITPIFKTCK
jgi:hypothetical protein